MEAILEILAIKYQDPKSIGKIFKDIGKSNHDGDIN